MRMISQGASRLNLTFVVAEQDLARVVEALHAEFFSRAGPGGVRVSGRNAMNLAIVGYGKMGRLIEQLARSTASTVALKLDEFNNANFEGVTRGELPGVDVAIDFSIPAAVAENVERIAALGVNMVLGTTGWIGADGPREGGGREVRHRAGVEPELLHRRQRVLPAGGRGGAAAQGRGRTTARGAGRSITRPRRTRPRAL